MNIRQTETLETLGRFEVRLGNGFRHGAAESTDDVVFFQTHDDGTATVIYTRTVADPDLQVEEGLVKIDQNGAVLTTSIDRQLPTKEAGR